MVNLKKVCRACGAYGVPADSEHAVFTNVNLVTTIGDRNPLKLRLPIVVPGLGSTYVAKRNWNGLAIGVAVSGCVLTIGENVCGMDDDSVIENGRIVKSPDMESRIKAYRDWQLDGYGDIVVQFNVEDTKLGVPEYVLNRLGIETVELKWGQGAKDIGGEVKRGDIAALTGDASRVSGIPYVTEVDREEALSILDG